MLCFALLCITLHCFALHYFAVLCLALLCIALHSFALHCIALLCFALHCIALHCLASLCFALHYFALLCFALHYFADFGLRTQALEVQGTRGPGTAGTIQGTMAGEPEIHGQSEDNPRNPKSEEPAGLFSDIPRTTYTRPFALIIKNPQRQSLIGEQ